MPSVSCPSRRSSELSLDAASNLLLLISHERTPGWAGQASLCGLGAPAQIQKQMLRTRRRWAVGAGAGLGWGGRASRGDGSCFCIQGFAGFQLATYCIEKYSARLKNYFPKQNAGIHQEARGVQCEQFTFVKYHMAAGRETLTCFNSTAGVGLLYSPCRWL